MKEKNCLLCKHFSTIKIDTVKEPMHLFDIIECKKYGLGMQDRVKTCKDYKPIITESEIHS